MPMNAMTKDFTFTGQHCIGSANTFLFSSALFLRNAKADACVYNGQFFEREIASLRRMHPAIAAWDDNAIGKAWAAYSRDVFTVRWVTTDWLRESDTGILAYIYFVSTISNVDVAAIPEADLYMWALGELRPWLSNIAPPAWKTEALSA